MHICGKFWVLQMSQPSLLICTVMHFWCNNLVIIGLLWGKQSGKRWPWLVTFMNPALASIQGETENHLGCVTRSLWPLRWSEQSLWSPGSVAYCYDSDVLLITVSHTRTWTVAKKLSRPFVQLAGVQSASTVEQRWSLPPETLLWLASAH